MKIVLIVIITIFMTLIMVQFQYQFDPLIKNYLCETSPVVTTEVVDMTFLPATSTASQTLAAVTFRTHI